MGKRLLIDPTIIGPVEAEEFCRLQYIDRDIEAREYCDHILSDQFREGTGSLVDDLYVLALEGKLI